MHLPRWTVYPALALLASMLVLAFPHPQGDRHAGAARQARANPARDAALVQPATDGAEHAAAQDQAGDDGESSAD
ncbi:MAG: hypothetical protein H6831_06605 [Planctomycetes bacterium]|nr:hypothetical protein [Planctomycetota bacterium]MCB9904060.1 hypothetical protein [Planctomycetota bacterium]